MGYGGQAFNRINFPIVSTMSVVTGVPVGNSIARSATIFVLGSTNPACGSRRELGPET